MIITLINGKTFEVPENCDVKLLTLHIEDAYMSNIHINNCTSREIINNASNEKCLYIKNIVKDDNDGVIHVNNRYYPLRNIISFGDEIDGCI